MTAEISDTGLADVREMLAKLPDGTWDVTYDNGGWLIRGDGEEVAECFDKEEALALVGLRTHMPAVLTRLDTAEAERDGYKRALLVMRGAYHATHDVTADTEQFVANVESCNWPVCVGARLAWAGVAEVSA